MCTQSAIQNQKALNHSLSENLNKQKHEWTDCHLNKSRMIWHDWLIAHIAMSLLDHHYKLSLIQVIMMPFTPGGTEGAAAV